MYYVYILQLSDGTYYTGFSSNLKQRIKTHFKGLVVHTETAKELMFYCAFNSKLKALSFEKYLKSSSGFAFRNKRLT
ncbi:MAG: GIY-YIG nuclease family protein [Candidatus Blackburnbacteria bacterium]|nr:GIY-YIG nuclease family protein [Candidatus Blackburnbacteria bacterium]